MEERLARLEQEMKAAADAGEFHRAGELKEKLETARRAAEAAAPAPAWKAAPTPAPQEAAVKPVPASRRPRIGIPGRGRKEAPQPEPATTTAASTPQAAAARTASMRADSADSAKRALAIVSAAAIAVAVGATVLAGVRMAQAGAALNRVERVTADYLTVSTDVKPGQTIEDANIEVERMPSEFVPSDAATKKDMEKLVGHAAGSRLTAGAPISLSTVSGSTDPGALPLALAEGKVGLMVSLDTASGLSPLATVGDMVSVLGKRPGSETVETLCTRVRILALDGALSGGAEGYATVTLELAPEQAEAVASAEGVRLAAEADPVVGGEVDPNAAA